jgi:hypothetical protein
MPADGLAQVSEPQERRSQDARDLAKKSQNPIADLISLPLQNNTYFGIDPADKSANVLNIQPVVPVGLGDWNVINRAILPVIYLPDLTSGLDVLPAGVPSGSKFGLGDLNYTAFFSPKQSGHFTWGIGPSINIPTATDRALGTEKWSLGPSAVALVTPGPWVVGLLARQLWSFAGDDDRKDVSQALFQPFINYNMEHGWALVTAPIITANWETDSDNRWTVPVGGGVSKLFKIGPQPVSASAQAYYNVERPDFGPDWQLRIALTFLFPK